VRGFLLYGEPRVSEQTSARPAHAHGHSHRRVREKRGGGGDARLHDGINLRGAGHRCQGHCKKHDATSKRGEKIPRFSGAFSPIPRTLPLQRLIRIM
jgi:hypothetical protein